MTRRLIVHYGDQAEGMALAVATGLREAGEDVDVELQHHDDAPDGISLDVRANPGEGPISTSESFRLADLATMIALAHHNAHVPDVGFQP